MTVKGTSATNPDNKLYTPLGYTGSTQPEPTVAPTALSPIELKQQEIDKLTADFNNLKMYNSDPNANLREAMLQANEQMGTADMGVYGRNKANMFAGFDAGFANASDNMNAALAKRGMANSGIYAKANKDLANEKAMNYANLNNQAWNNAIQQGDAYRQQRMANLTGYTQLGRGMSGTTQNYLGQAGGTFGNVSSQAGQTALGLGSLNNSYNSAKWNADAQNAAGKGSMTGSIVGAGITAFSDIRLKDNIEKIGELNGHNIYLWDWNDEGQALTGQESSFGVIAQEAMMVNPDIVIEHENGYLMVDYGKILEGGE